MKALTRQARGVAGLVVVKLVAIALWGMVACGPTTEHEVGAAAAPRLTPTEGPTVAVALETRTANPRGTQTASALAALTMSPRALSTATPIPLSNDQPATTVDAATTLGAAMGTDALVVSADLPCQGSQVSRALVAWLPGTARVLYANGPRLFSVDADGSGLELLVDASRDIRLGSSRYVAGHITHAAASPDGMHVAYAMCHHYEPDGREDPRILQCIFPWRYTSEPKCDYPITADRTFAFYEIPAEIGSWFYEISRRQLATETSHRLFVGDAPMWSPSGDRIAFYVSGDRVTAGIFVDPRDGASPFPLQRGLYTMAADGSDVRRILPWSWGSRGEAGYPVVDAPPAWSPDGQWLAVVRREGAEKVIYVASVAGEAAPRRLADTVSGPSWSPDGTRIAFARPDGDTIALYTLAADGSDRRRVTTIAGWQPRNGVPASAEPWIETAGWSPTGDQLAYACGQSVCVVDMDGTPVGTSPVLLEGGSVAAWSPDGARLAIASADRAAAGLVLYHMAPDGSDVRVLAHGQADGTLVPINAASTTKASLCIGGTTVPNPSKNTGLVSDCEVLLELRDALGGSVLLNWNPVNVISEWAGVVLSGTPPRVTEIQLEPLYNDRVGFHRVLSGIVPAELSKLTKLRVLNLGGHNLSGVIPADLGNLKHLRTLRLNRNNLIGIIPPELGALDELQHLDVSYNTLSGELPPELGNLTRLVHLHLGNNSLAGTIPPEFTQLRNLKVLRLGHNGFTGPIPAFLGQLANLDHLDLAANQFTGSIPKELSQLADLETLTLVRNQLTGSIPPELGQMAELKTLGLAGNQLTGSIPSELGRLETIEQLLLEGNRFTGSIPTELSQSHNLEVIDLDGNDLTGEIPRNLARLPNLKTLSLSFNRLTGEIPEALSSLANLQVLWLNNNQLTGQIPQELGRLSKLVSLFLHDNSLTGRIPATLGSLGNLRYLNLSGNRLTGSIPLAFRDLSELDELFVAGNQLEGCVPEGLWVVDREELALPDCGTGT